VRSSTLSCSENGHHRSPKKKKQKKNREREREGKKRREKKREMKWKKKKGERRRRERSQQCPLCSLMACDSPCISMIAECLETYYGHLTRLGV
jgi:hypothetical protein